MEFFLLSVSELCIQKFLLWMSACVIQGQYEMKTVKQHKIYEILAVKWGTQVTWNIK